MKKILLFVFALLAFVFQSCDKKEIMFHVDERFIYFDYGKDHEDHVYDFSFVNIKEDEGVVKIPMRYSGYRLTEDATYAVTVGYEDAETGLKPTEEYVIPSFVFRKGLFADSLCVTVKRTPRMQSGQYSMVVRLVTNDAFQATMRDCLDVTIVVTDDASQRPDWWTSDVTSSYLGTFSEKKYRLFATEIYSADYGALSTDDQRYYALLFRNWLQRNPQTEEDGTEMTVPVK